MKAFLMSLDMKSWRAVISGWEYPTEKDEAGQTVRKSELKWTKDEDDAAVGNSRALNALFNVVDPNIFKLINTCKSVKAAWDILEVAFEGTSKVKISRLQILTSRFEALQMGEDETVVEFNVRVLDIANESDALEEKMSDSKLVRKKEIGTSTNLSKGKAIEEHRVMQGNDAFTESVVMLTKQVAKLKNQFHKHMGNQRNNREDLSLRQSRISDTSSSGHHRRKEHERGKGIEASKSDKYATFSDEEDYSKSNDEDLGMALISICTMNDEENVQTHDQPESKNLTDDAADRKKTEDQEVILQQQERIQDLVEENQRFLSSIMTYSTKEEGLTTKEASDLQKGTHLQLDTRQTKYLRSPKTEWHRKIHIENCKVALTSVKSPNSSDWYFDSGCSRHMTGNADFFSDLSECKAGSVVFGDGGKGKIIGKGTINHPGLPFLLDVRLVAKADAIIGLPPLSFSSLESCSECPAGKQVKSVHKPINISSTSHILKLLHIDLMGLMQIESLGRKRVILRLGTTTFSYELWKGRKPNVKYFHIFGSTLAYRVYNQRSKTVMESINVIIDDLGTEPDRNLDYEDEVFWNSLSHKPAEGELDSTARTNETTHLPSHLGLSRSDMSTPSTSAIHTDTRESEALVSASQHSLEQTTGATDSSKCNLLPPTHIAKNHPSSFIIGDIHSGIITQKKQRKDYAKMVANVCYTSSLEPTTVFAALFDEHWILAIQEELLQFERNQVWELVPKPPYGNIIGTKWIFKNKTMKKVELSVIKLDWLLKDTLK
ncbi:Receptor-like protein 12 [Cucumis melo var. makuwa]|uniref:Receptor-like protein 12 n=1 Tax=Cucumis melo var. makuwa TaxID=1194695 RepID=A0A5D3CQ77_CUCMM|nr:Receptor-like protein 12 [Cucumis melo var. makuwa]TYK14077.1 Receptor-like protein 12 [Cucumis melo var. makuwa]